MNLCMLIPSQPRYQNHSLMLPSERYKEHLQLGPSPFALDMSENRVFPTKWLHGVDNCFLIEGSLEVKLPTIWTDEKQSRAEAERRERLDERRVEEKESEERRCRCAKR